MKQINDKTDRGNDRKVVPLHSKRNDMDAEKLLDEFAAITKISDVHDRYVRFAIWSQRVINRQRLISCRKL